MIQILSLIHQRVKRDYELTRERKRNRTKEEIEALKKYNRGQWILFLKIIGVLILFGLSLIVIYIVGSIMPTVNASPTVILLIMIIIVLCFISNQIDSSSKK